jgi:hypothetical protein
VPRAVRCVSTGDVGDTVMGTSVVLVDELTHLDTIYAENETEF